MSSLFHPLRSRLLLALLVLLGLLWTAVLVTLDRHAHAQARAQAGAMLHQAGQAVTQQLAQRADGLRRGAELLAQDAGLMQQLRRADGPALAHTLTGQAQRLGADLVLLLSLDGRLLLHNRPGNDLSGLPFPSPGLVQAARAAGSSVGYVAVAGQTYLTVLVPVGAPVQVAWLALGHAVHDGLARKLAGIGGASLSLARVQQQRAGLLATSLPGAQRPVAQTWLTRLAPAGATWRQQDAAGQAHWLHRLPLASQAEHVHFMLLSVPEPPLLAPYRDLATTLLIIALLSLTAFVYAGLWFARRVTLPLHALTQAHRRLGRGRYETRVAASTRDELGQLAHSFNRMAEDLQGRAGRSAAPPGAGAGQARP